MTPGENLPMVGEESRETPPSDGRSKKTVHSPWSAPHDRRKRNKNARLGATDGDIEYTSPPKRLNGGPSPFSQGRPLPTSAPGGAGGGAGPPVGAGGAGAASTAAGAPWADALAAGLPGGNPGGGGSRDLSVGGLVPPPPVLSGVGGERASSDPSSARGLETSPQGLGDVRRRLSVDDLEIAGDDGGFIAAFRDPATPQGPCREGSGARKTAAPVPASPASASLSPATVDDSSPVSTAGEPLLGGGGGDGAAPPGGLPPIFSLRARASDVASPPAPRPAARRRRPSSPGGAPGAAALALEPRPAGTGARFGDAGGLGAGLARPDARGLSDGGGVATGLHVRAQGAAARHASSPEAIPHSSRLSSPSTPTKGRSASSAGLFQGLARRAAAAGSRLAQAGQRALHASPSGPRSSARLDREGGAGAPLMARAEGVDGGEAPSPPPRPHHRAAAACFSCASPFRSRRSTAMEDDSDDERIVRATPRRGPGRPGRADPPGAPDRTSEEADAGPMSGGRRGTPASPRAPRAAAAAAAAATAAAGEPSASLSSADRGNSSPEEGRPEEETPGRDGGEWWPQRVESAPSTASMLSEGGGDGGLWRARECWNSSSEDEGVGSGPLGRLLDLDDSEGEGDPMEEGRGRGLFDERPAPPIAPPPPHVITDHVPCGLEPDERPTAASRAPGRWARLERVPGGPAAPGAAEGRGRRGGAAPSPGLGPSAAEGAASPDALLGRYREPSSGPPTAAELEDLLREACSISAARHPRDAEEMVAEACKLARVRPSTSVLRRLDKLWAAHEQLQG